MPDPQIPIDTDLLAAQRAAEAVRDSMFADDPALHGLGIEITRIAPGSATATMTVRRDMLNGFATCHGGIIATLCDSAFAYACNSRNEFTVASGFSVDIVAPAMEGDLLVARCDEVSKSGRTGVYDVDVRNQRDVRIAVFRGRSYTIKGKPVVGVRETKIDR